MRRIVFAICTTVAGLVLLFSWQTSLNRSVTTTTADAGGTVGTSSGSSSDTGTDTAGDSGTDTSTDAGTSADAETTASATGTTTYDGAVASTRYGNVQVRITVTDGAVAAAEAIDYPNQDRHDQQINAYAIPILNQEAVTAQSANIAMVSGATVTSGGYVQSLQDALDQAGL